MGKSLVIRISPVLRHFFAFFFSAIEDVSAATAKYDWGRLAPVKTAQQLKRQAAPEAHASQTGEKRQRNSFGMCGTQSIIAAMEHAAGNKRQRNSFGMCGTQSIIATMEDAAGIKNEARLEKMRQMDC